MRDCAPEDESHPKRGKWEKRAAGRQILFVDDDHSTTSDFRARLAHGLLTSIAEWNGYGRSLVVDSCGLHALEG